MRFTFWIRWEGQAKPFLWTEDMHVLKHARSHTDSVIRLLCSRVHCLALLPSGNTRPGPASQWLSHGPQRSRGSMGLFCSSLQKEHGIGAVRVKHEHAQASEGTASGKSASSSLSPSQPPYLIRLFYFLVVNSIFFSGFHTVMELVKPLSQLYTALGGLRPCCSMWTVYRHSLLFRDLFLWPFCC